MTKRPYTMRTSNIGQPKVVAHHLLSCRQRPSKVCFTTDTFRPLASQANTMPRIQSLCQAREIASRRKPRAKQLLKAVFC